MPRRSGLTHAVIKRIYQATEDNELFPIKLRFETEAQAKTARRLFYNHRAKAKKNAPHAPTTDWLYRFVLTQEDNILIIDDLEPEFLFETVAESKPNDMEDLEAEARKRSVPADAMAALLEKGKLGLKR